MDALGCAESHCGHDTVGGLLLLLLPFRHCRLKKALKPWAKGFPVPVSYTYAQAPREPHSGGLGEGGAPGRGSRAGPTRGGAAVKLMLAPPYNRRAKKKSRFMKRRPVPCSIVVGLVVNVCAFSDSSRFAKGGGRRTVEVTHEDRVVGLAAMALRNEGDDGQKSATVRRRLSNGKGEVREPFAHSFSGAAGFSFLWILIVVEKVLVTNTCRNTA